MKKVSEIPVAAQLVPGMRDVVLLVRSWRLLFWQVVRFCIVGIINAAVDILALNILVLCFPTHNATTLLLYNSIAFALGALNSYFLNKYWTFQRQQAITRGELLRFATLSVVAFLCNDAVIWIAAQILHPLIASPILWANASKLSAISGTVIISYLGMSFWVFTSKSQESGEKGKVYSVSTTGLQEQRSSDDDENPTQPGKAVGEFRTSRSLSVVLPAYNEEEAIAETIHEVVDTLALWIQDFEIIVVNDGSWDATGAILDTIAAANRRVRAVHHPVNRGYGAALVTGFEAATKGLTFFMDSDGQFDILDLECFFPLIEQYDAVLGYRIDRQDTWMRKFNAWGWKALVGMVLGVNVRDVDCAFKLYRGDFFREHRLETRGAMINAEMIYKFTRAGHTYTQVGVRHLVRRGGRATGAKPSVILRAFRELFIYAWKWHREEQKEGKKEKLSQTIRV